jgi:hypothetical protein
MRAIAAMLLAVGCDAGTKLAVSWPDLGAAETVVFAVNDDGVLNVEVKERGARPTRVLASDPAVLEILAFEEPPSSLGLPVGELLPVPGGDRFPMPAKIYRANVVDDGLTDWELRAEMSTELASFGTPPRPSPCARFEILNQFDTPFTYTAFTHRGRAFIGTRQGLYRLSENGAEKFPTSPEILVRGSVAADGNVWVSTDGGALFRATIGEVSATLDQVGTTTSGETMTWLATDGEDVYSLSEYGVFERFDGVLSRVVYRFPREHTLGAGLERVAPGELVVVHQLFGQAVRYRGGTVTREPVPSDYYLEAVRQVPGLGTVAASEIGRFFLSTGGSWSELAPSPYSLRVLTIVATPNGFLYGGEFGEVGEYLNLEAFCPVQNVHSDSVWFLVEAGGVIYVMNRGDQGMARLTVMRRG